MRERRRANAPLPLPPAQFRSRLIEDIEHMWIEGVQQCSPYQDLLRSLDRPEVLKALADPWQFCLRENDGSSTALPPDTSISELYAQSAGSLLLLGEPGAGKTTLLLKLARELVNRARADGQQAIPVVLNLSTWTARQSTLDGWLFSELAARYDVERYHARPWLREDLLVLLLDGLDELAEAERAACIEAINVYYQEHPAVQLVVCCHADAYVSQAARLDLRSAVQIQPLTEQQVEAYFDAMGEQADAIRRAWRVDAGLQTLTQSPLLLTLLLNLYHAGNAPEIPIAMPIQEQRERILTDYAAQRLAGDAGPYPRGQVRHWLGWIARQMQVREQSIFYLEHMQPAWLPTPAARLSLSALCGLLAALPFVPLVALLVRGTLGIGSGLLAGLLVGLLYGWLVWSRGEIRPVDNVIAILRGLRKNRLVWLLGGLLAGVLGISIGGVLYGLLTLLLYGLAVLTIVGPDDEGWRDRPGGRIWRSGQNGLAIGLLAALGFGLLGVPFAALYIGLIIGLFAALFAGGSTFLQYILLRFLLARPKNNAMPRDLLAFLDYATSQRLLCKVGAGYMFPHRLLLDYFATQNHAS